MQLKIMMLGPSLVLSFWHLNPNLDESIRRFRNLSLESWGLRAPCPLPQRNFSLEVVRSSPQKKIGGPGGASSAFFRSNMAARAQFWVARGRSQARFGRPKRLHFRCFSLRGGPFQRDSLTLMKHRMGARILSFELRQLV